jgi:hypothetical protein
MKNIFILLFAITCTSSVFSQTLVRGPYMQQLTSTTINIRWRTDVASDAKVYYGTDMNNLNLTATNPISNINHEVALTGLQPFTKYYYKIESNNITLSGPDTMHRFTTAPVPGTAQPIRVWATGDFGKANSGQRKTRDSYLQYAANTHTDVWLWLGDNAYNDGTDQEYQAKVFHKVDAFGELFKFMPFYPCPGNHDYNSICAPPGCNKDPLIHTGPYYDIMTLPKLGEAGGVASNLENYYSFDYGNAHFISLNSELGSIANAAYDWIGVLNGDYQNSPIMQWLIQDLQSNTKPWVIAYWHQPPYSKGSHDSDAVWELFMKAMREHFVPVLEQYGVDIILNGHSHVFERSYLIKGHTTGTSADFNPAIHMVDGSSGNETLGEEYVKYIDGPDAGKGTVYVVCGNSGSSEGSAPLVNNPHPVMYFSEAGDTAYGSFIMDIDGNKLTGKYLAASGQIRDQFTIKKQSITGIEGRQNNFFKKVKNVKVMPNPFSKSAKLEYELFSATDVTVDAYSLDGKTVYNIFKGKQQQGKQSVTIDSDALQLASGQYVLKITAGNASSFEQIIKVD